MLAEASEYLCRCLASSDNGTRLDVELEGIDVELEGIARRANISGIVSRWISL